MEYTIQRVEATPDFTGGWQAGVWGSAATLALESVRPESSHHRPRTEVKAAYDDSGVYVLFRVMDRYVRSTRTEFNSSVCKDSCVEFFVEPQPGKGYFNFETNCGGTLLCSYIEDPTRTEEGFKRFTRIPEAQGQQVVVHHSMPCVVEPERVGPQTWFNGIHIPYGLLAAYVADLENPAGQVWRGNFYKCGDHTSHPHWMSWAPVEELNFHRPQDFGMLRFGG